MKHAPQEQTGSPWHDLTARLVLRAKAQDSCACYLLTSCGNGEGKTTVAREVATQAAEAGLAVGVLTIGSPEPAEGQSLGALAEPIPFEADRALGYALWTLPASFGALPSLAQEPRHWVTGCELMLIDTPPMGTFMQQHLSPRVDGVVLVANSRSRRLAEVVRAAAAIKEDGGTLLGVVLNRHKSPLPRWLDKWGDRP